jgi:hypothetical protein
MQEVLYRKTAVQEVLYHQVQLKEVLYTQIEVQEMRFHQTEEQRCCTAEVAACTIRQRCTCGRLEGTVQNLSSSRVTRVSMEQGVTKKMSSILADQWRPCIRAQIGG